MSNGRIINTTSILTIDLIEGGKISLSYKNMVPINSEQNNNDSQGAIQEDNIPLHHPDEIFLDRYGDDHYDEVLPQSYVNAFDEEEAYDLTTRSLTSRPSTRGNKKSSLIHSIKYNKDVSVPILANPTNNINSKIIRSKKEKRRKKNSKKQLIRRRKRDRQEKVTQQLVARKQNIQDSIVITHSMYIQSKRDVCEEGDYGYNDEEYNEYKILSAEELGVERGPMYDRLLSILQGDDIRPEDYDLLLQLDKNNTKTTMDEDDISKFSMLVIGEEEEDISSHNQEVTKEEEGKEGRKETTSNKVGCYDSSSSSYSKCEICLESFQDLPPGTQIRKLPCKHMFCKECIDQWLSEVSTKCPNLACYWRSNEDSEVENTSR